MVLGCCLSSLCFKFIKLNVSSPMVCIILYLLYKEDFFNSNQFYWFQFYILLTYFFLQVNLWHNLSLLSACRMFMRLLQEHYGILLSTLVMLYASLRKEESLLLLISVLHHFQRWHDSWLHWHWLTCLMGGK